MGANGFLQSLVSAKAAIGIGIVNTIIAAFSAVLTGTAIGIAAGFLVTFANKYVKMPFRLAIDIIRGIPGLVVIFTIYYYLDFFVRLPPLVAGIIALSVSTSAQTAELTRGALQSIPPGQIEAGRAIGLRFGQIILDILLPQALVRMLPPWVNTATETVKGSTLLALIGISELLLVAQQLIATNNHALKYYIFVGVIFFLLNSAIEFAGKTLEKKIRF